MNDEPYDPLAAYRRERWKSNNMDMSGSQAGKPGQTPEPLSEHQALELAIDALNQIPNRSLTGEYRNTYELIPVLKQVYERGKTTEKLTELAPRLLDTLELCEDALSDLARSDDGTPSRQALFDIRDLRRQLYEEDPEQGRRLFRLIHARGEEPKPPEVDLDLER